MENAVVVIWLIVRRFNKSEARATNRSSCIFILSPRSRYNASSLRNVNHRLYSRNKDINFARSLWSQWKIWGRWSAIKWQHYNKNFEKPQRQIGNISKWGCFTKECLQKSGKTLKLCVEHPRPILVALLSVNIPLSDPTPKTSKNWKSVKPFEGPFTTGMSSRASSLVISSWDYLLLSIP